MDHHVGWVADYGEISKSFERIKSIIDHAYLNDVISNPTAENLAEYIYRNMKRDLPMLLKVRVQEYNDSGAEYSG